MFWSEECANHLRSFAFLLLVRTWAPHGSTSYCYYPVIPHLQLIGLLPEDPFNMFSFYLTKQVENRAKDSNPRPPKRTY